MDLTEQIRKALKESTFTAVELSRRTGIHAVNIRQFKGGDRLSLENLEKLAAALGFTATIKKTKK